MAELTIGDTLEVGGLAGPRFEETYIRGFEIDRGDTVMSSTHIALWNGLAWQRLRSFEIEIVDIHYAAGAGLYCLGSRGELFLFDGRGWRTVSEGISPRIRVSTLHVLRAGIFAMGPMDRLYRLETDGAWTPQAVPEAGSTLLGLAESDGGEMAICGTHGLVATGSPGSFARVEIAMDLDLHDALFERRLLYVCGEAATLLARDGEEWREVEPGDQELDFLRLRRFDGNVLVAADDRILAVKDFSLVPFADVECQNLAVVGDSLFSQGLDRIMVLRQGEWREFPVSFSIPDIPSATARPSR